MVPNGWKIHSISDIAEVKGGKRLPKGYTLQPEPNGHPYIRVTDMFDGGVSLDSIQYVPEEAVNAISRYKISTSDIFITVAGTLGIVGIISEQLDGANLTENADKLTNLKIDQRFLLEMLRSPIVQSHIEAEKTTNAQPKLALTRIKGFKIPVPPIPEQRKIAKILSIWDKAIHTTERLINNSKQQKKALMQQLLTGKKRLLDDSGKPFEGEWEEITLEKLAKYRRGSFPQPYGNPEWVDEVNGYPFIQVYDIDKNMKLKPDTKIKISDAAIGKSVFIPKETVIVSLQGSIGRVAITQYDAYVDRTVLLFQEFIVPMDKVFFAFIIQELFEIEKTKAPGGTIKTITKEVLSNFKVHIPSITEQQKIAFVLINADQEIELLEQQLADLKQEKKALMQQLLTGKRRVAV
ncbi:MAG: restriction endonuclease subunit S [Gammaproteobacteria bacterium]|nr:restriction endonuclease subunit S [Gammaproteobacteria bacterium]